MQVLGIKLNTQRNKIIKNRRIMKQVLLIISLLFITAAKAQEQVPAVMQVEIKTSAECGDCKDRIEEKLNYTKGIVFAELDYKTKLLVVKFKTKKISVAEIKTILSELGYDADEVKAIPSAQKALPLCCQPGGMGK